MDAYNNYPHRKPSAKTLLKILWALHDLVLMPAILWTIEMHTNIEIPRFITQGLLAPCIVVMLFAEWTYMTYIVSAVLLVSTIIVLVKEKRASRSIFWDIVVFSVFLLLCILGLMSSHEYVTGLMSV